MIDVYISYADEDKLYRDCPVKWLKPKHFVTWDRSNITAGYHRNKDIADHLEKSQIFVLLISADYLASDTCLSEEKGAYLIKQKLQENCIVLPVYIRHCAIEESRFGYLPILPGNKYENGDYIPVGTPGNDKDWKKIVKAIENAILTLAPNTSYTITEEE